jgi:hypothetical protein
LFKKTLRQKTNFSCGLNVICPVQSLVKKYFFFPEMQITPISNPSCSTEGRLEIVTDAGRDAMDAEGA